MSLEPADDVRFIERSTLSKGHHWEVRKGFAAIGYIRKDRLSGRYQYFSGLANSSQSSLEADTIESLKTAVRESV
jgi:hypothetical protein